MKMLVNGMGCTESGGKLVLDSLLMEFPDDQEIVVIYPSNKIFRFQKESSITIVFLNKILFGKILRVPLELSYNLLFAIGIFQRFINLSNYDLLFFRNKVQYFHNPLLLDLDSQHSINFIKKFGVKNSIRLSEKIFIQTNHMRNQLETFCLSFNLNPKKVEVLKPKHTLTHEFLAIYHPDDRFRFFYPASNFPHKRADLAIDSIDGLGGGNVFLDITISKDSNQKKVSKNVNYLGKISHLKVLDLFNLSNALLFTSERETLGLPLLEALNCRLPAVLPNMVYAKEIYGDAAVYFEDFNIESIQKAILLLMKNYDEMKRRAEVRIVQELQERVSWKDHWTHFLK